MQHMGIVFDIKKFSIHDGPGIRTTVFFKGCPLRCWWCHNPESQAPMPELSLHPDRCIHCGACLTACAQGAIHRMGESISTDAARCLRCGECAEVCYAEARQRVGQDMSVTEVLTEIERDRAFYDESAGGVTFSGGEPLMQPDFLLALLRACQAREIHTAVDTCGFAARETLMRIQEYVDLFLYDLKLMDEDKHRKFTGVSNALILSNLQALAEHARAIRLRVAVIPGVNDDDENILAIGRFASTHPGLHQIDLLPYHPSGVAKYARLHKVYALSQTRPPTDERMAEIAQTLRGFGLQVKIGG